MAMDVVLLAPGRRPSLPASELAPQLRLFALPAECPVNRVAGYAMLLQTDSPVILVESSCRSQPQHTFHDIEKARKHYICAFSRILKCTKS